MDPIKTLMQIVYDAACPPAHPDWFTNL